MAKNGFRVFDSDMHVMEPPDLWERYIAAEFRAIAPRGVLSENVRDLRITFLDQNVNGPPIRRRTRQGRNYERNQALYRGDAARGWSGEVQLEAMDVEGLDVAVMFPSRGLNVLVGPDGGARVADARFAAAIARAYNDWLHGLCQTDPRRMLGAGMISVYDINDAVAEAHRVVEELGFKAVFLRSNIVNGKAWHDTYYEPLWDALEGLQIPLGLHQATASSVPQLTRFWFGSPSGMQRAYGQPIGQMFGVGSFLGGGILERHPTLKVAFLEANCSWLPWLLWRLDEAYELEGDLDMSELTMRRARTSNASASRRSSRTKPRRATRSTFSATTTWFIRPTIPTATRAIRMPRRAFSSYRFRTRTNGRSCGITALVSITSATPRRLTPAKRTGSHRLRSTSTGRRFSHGNQRPGCFGTIRQQDAGAIRARARRG